MSVVIKVKRGTAANATAENEILSSGELGFETDTGKFKIGDGSTAWNDLGYSNPDVFFDSAFFQGEGTESEMIIIRDGAITELKLSTDVQTKLNSGGSGGTGVDGEDGREVELQKSETHVQWRYVGDIAWIDLIPLSELKGDTGDQGPIGLTGPEGSPGIEGEDGLSAYQIAVNNGFVGTESEWIASLEGPQGLTGETGLQGPEGPQGIQGPEGPAGQDASVEAVIRESNTVLFDQDYIIGNAAPRTGNVLYDFTGSKLGASTIMIHQDAAAFTIEPTKSIVLSGTASSTVPNYIYFLLVNKTSGTEIVHVTISQEKI